MNELPYIKLTLLTDIGGLADDGYYHVPMAIESWPPGIKVQRILQLALTSLQEDTRDDTEV